MGKKVAGRPGANIDTICVYSEEKMHPIHTGAFTHWGKGSNKQREAAASTDITGGRRDRQRESEDHGERETAGRVTRKTKD